MADNDKAPKNYPWVAPVAPASPFNEGIRRYAERELEKTPMADDDRPEDIPEEKWKGMSPSDRAFFRKNSGWFGGLISGRSKSANSPEKISDLPGTKTLDYLGLGLLLAPPAVVIDMYLKGTDIDWHKTIIAVVASCVFGGICVWASHRWQAWRTSNNRLLPYFAASESRFLGKAVIVAAAIGLALVLRSFLSGEPPAAPAVFTQQQVDQKVADVTASLKSENARLRADLEETARQRDAARHQPQPQSQEQPSMSTGPIAWDSTISPWTSSDANGTTFLGIAVTGTSNGLIDLTRAYIDSEITGERKILQISKAPGPQLVPLSDINQIPPNVRIELWARFDPPIHGQDLLTQWGKFRFHAEYSGTAYEKVFDEDYMRKLLSLFPGANIGPHITLKPK